MLRSIYELHVGTRSYPQLLLKRGVMLATSRLFALSKAIGNAQQQRGMGTDLYLENPSRLLEELKTTQNESHLVGQQTDTLDGKRHNETRDEWTEPALEDLDRSIPQVDCAFIADLVRSRNLQRRSFMQKKSQIEAKVASLSRALARSVEETSKYLVLGSLEGGNSGPGTIVSNGNDTSAVSIAPEVLAQLTDDERDALLASRPDYDDGFVLLDCRTVNEVTSWGIIEGAKVLPAHEMFEGFHLTVEEFEVEFGFPKPKPEQKIICYCQYGPRSLMAAQVLSWMGYSKVLHFRDGYYEWGKQYNLLLRRWMLHDKETGNEVKRQVVFQAGLELQREIAPEFNELPIKEASRYKIDTTRSRGQMLVGEGVREEAYREVQALVSGLNPLLLPGVLDDDDRVMGSSSVVGHSGERLQRFLQESTGTDVLQEDTRPPMSLAEAQEKAMQTFAHYKGSNQLS
ncbi:hypothetical protein TRVL_08977 [Trypanosoma vivax]|uniref:Rhodanese domain-containing protein n=1 Tax=Trypanosoma vivax (strain Y486) TaxID=1055687 RepID=G0TV73_TRYVY|nr:hypothetical protein TRVL_08977 [Trypanosoma vivax]CCC47839.1 conserved hypothetical protein, fragment [Trypanosoma vivax Y486]